MITTRIKVYLKKRGISQEELGKKLGTSGQNIRNILNKEHIHTSTIEKIAAVLSIDVSELLSYHEDGTEVKKNGDVLICPKCGSRFKLVEEA